MAQGTAPVQRDLQLHLPFKMVATTGMEVQMQQNHQAEYHESAPKKAVRQPPQSIGQYEVSTAVLCALTQEADAVQALFDRGLTVEYARTMGDTNTYSFGVIGRHNTVLVHMPGMGTRHAASVAAHCGATFPTITLVLIVGICGGVPFLEDGTEVLLGDVAVSEDLVIYDFGRQYPDTFVRKSGKVESARKPPSEILGFLAKLKGRSAQIVLSEKAAIYMETLREDLGSIATYPGAQRDILFQSEYRHKHQDPSSCEECGLPEALLGGVCEESRVSSCSQLNCDTAKSITRQRQKDWLQKERAGQANYCPILYIGRFASGDKVMKSGRDRDAIARNEGVIAFEMEGGGVWDTMPCIIIKGVCDYADSHKDKRWQGFASATAAAYMKAILEEWRK
ncbi:hypothetical protein NW768_012051 [Fusarium equiseti]|uniref:Nucleoside phosphorylase domain-containing protein n=1 Tax=Fusarium equiseti TaxID=61235 RepID=A0ABQ8QVT2_FUSEQ|nr:hypothetical protein NW768_012051 [Fusarium equiseti]